MEKTAVQSVVRDTLKVILFNPAAQPRMPEVVYAANALTESPWTTLWNLEALCRGVVNPQTPGMVQYCGWNESNHQRYKTVKNCQTNLTGGCAIPKCFHLITERQVHPRPEMLSVWGLTCGDPITNRKCVVTMTLPRIRTYV